MNTSKMIRLLTDVLQKVVQYNEQLDVAFNAEDSGPMDVDRGDDNSDDDTTNTDDEISSIATDVQVFEAFICSL